MELRFGLMEAYIKGSGLKIEQQGSGKWSMEILVMFIMGTG